MQVFILKKTKEQLRNEVHNLINKWFTMIDYYNEGWGRRGLETEKKKIMKYIKYLEDSTPKKLEDFFNE